MIRTFIETLARLSLALTSFGQPRPSCVRRRLLHSRPRFAAGWRAARLLGQLPRLIRPCCTSWVRCWSRDCARCQRQRRAHGRTHQRYCISRCHPRVPSAITGRHCLSWELFVTSCLPLHPTLCTEIRRPPPVALAPQFISRDNKFAELHAHQACPQPPRLPPIYRFYHRPPPTDQNRGKTLLRVRTRRTGNCAAASVSARRVSSTNSATGIILIAKPCQLCLETKYFFIFRL